MTDVQVMFHPEAITEARAANEWYGERDAAAAAAFVEELDHAIAGIREGPSAWPPYIVGTRRYVLRRFPFQPIYREMPEAIQILAVAHGRRRPGYWKAR